MKNAALAKTLLQTELPIGAQPAQGWFYFSFDVLTAALTR
jgi:hypothetical protein